MANLKQYKVKKGTIINNFVEVTADSENPVVKLTEEQAKMYGNSGVVLEEVTKPDTKKTLSSSNSSDKTNPTV